MAFFESLAADHGLAAMSSCLKPLAIAAVADSNSGSGHALINLDSSRAGVSTQFVVDTVNVVMRPADAEC